MSEIIHKMEPVEHWIVDGKAYRLATEKDIGKLVLVTDYEIAKRKCPPEVERTLTSVGSSAYPFRAGGNGWRYAYIQDDSLLQSQVEHIVDCVTVEQAIAQRIMEDKATKQAEATVTNWAVLPTTKPIDWTKPVRTKDGRAVRVLCTDGPGEYPVAGYIEGEMNPRSWSLNGQIHKRTPHSEYDLENAPQRIQREWWINVYPDSFEWCAYKTRNDADDAADTGRIACVKITIDCEEGEGL